MVSVSIIIPCYNEQATIEQLLTAIKDQTFPVGDMEIIIADGMSTDGTRDVIKSFQKTHPEVNVILVDNSKSNIPAGLNRAIENAAGEFLIRLDAHSVPASGYVESCMRALKAGKGDVVGGIWNIMPGEMGWISRSIAAAASNPLGVGDAHYRVGGSPQAVDTVPFGAFRRVLVDRIGLFDEELLSNEDYEFNARVREMGGVIWLDPDISSVYYARSSLRALARQYWRYGYWKFRMLLRYPSTFRWRQLAGGFVLSWLILGVVAVFIPFVRILLILEAVIYLLALIVAGIQVSWKHKDLPLFIGVPLSIAVMHFSWGTAFLWSAVKYLGYKIVEAL